MGGSLIMSQGGRAAGKRLALPLGLSWGGGSRAAGNSLALGIGVNGPLGTASQSVSC